MGLDISAYQRVTFVRERKDGEHYDCNRETYLYNMPEFSARCELPEGIYATSGDVDGFACGSYGRYGKWREALAALVGVSTDDIWNGPEDIAKATPFYELINFADNEGTIGPAVSAKLAADFDKYAERAAGHRPDWPSWHETYEDFRKAFHLAANGGVVQFH